MLRTLRTLAAALLLAAGFAHADEASIRKGVETFVNAPGSVESVKKTPYGGLYEVVMKTGELIYTDANASFIIDGSVIDTKTHRNVTQARMAQLLKIDFKALPLDQAIKQVRGNGKHVFATFEDPNCGYCKRFAKELAGVKDITVYTFLLPILGPDSAEKSKAIWCAKDRAAAWNDWMINNKAPAAEKCDSSTIEKNVALGQRLKVSATPTIILSDGNRLPGAVSAAQLEKILVQVGGK